MVSGFCDASVSLEYNDDSLTPTLSSCMVLHLWVSSLYLASTVGRNVGGIGR